MKKTQAPSKSTISTHLGGGLHLHVEDHSDEEEPSKKVPHNSGLKYFKWVVQTRDLLLKECLQKEVWDVPHGKTMEVWKEITNILKSFLNCVSLRSSIGFFGIHQAAFLRHVDLSCSFDKRMKAAAKVILKSSESTSCKK